MNATSNIKKQLQAEEKWYLEAQLHVNNPNDWELIRVEDNLFFDKNKNIVGEPDFAFINQKTNECIVLLNISRINFNNHATAAITSGIERIEENHARVLAHLVNDTCFEKCGKYPNKISSYIIYADFSQTKVSLYTNSDTLIQLSAAKVCNLQHMQLITAENLSVYMSKTPFVLVSDKEKLEDNQEWDTYF